MGWAGTSRSGPSLTSLTRNTKFSIQMRFNCSALMMVAALGLTVGCGGGVTEQTITIQGAKQGPVDPLDEPRMLLARYADGQAIGSESTSFEYHVNQVRKVDPALADVLDKGFKELVAAQPAALRTKAKALLDQIGGPAATPAPAITVTTE